jgi:hypothetical protein
MQVDALRSQQKLRLKAVAESAASAQVLRNRIQQDLDARILEVEGLTLRLDILTKVGELFRALLDRLVLDHVRSIERVVSDGLRTIFYDQDLAFEAEVSQRYNKIAIDFVIRQDNERVPVRGHPLESFGGGPASIASLILRVIAILRLKRWPFLALDETLAAVSDDYVDQTGLFLRKLAESTGLSILLVTHKQAFLDHASIAYRGTTVIDDDGSRHLKLQREIHA